MRHPFTHKDDIYNESLNSRCAKIPSIMKFSKEAWLKVKATVGHFPAETGGMLLGDVETGVIKRFTFDSGSNQRRSVSAYDPDVDFLNSELDKARNEGLDLLGFMHSHPRGVSRLSGGYGNTGDVAYLNTIFKAMPEVNYLYTPIVFSIADQGPFVIYSYIARRGNVDGYHHIPIEVEEGAKFVPIVAERKTWSASKPRTKVHTPLITQEPVLNTSIFASSVLIQVANNLGEVTTLNKGGLYFGEETSGLVTKFIFEMSNTNIANHYQPSEEFWKTILKSLDDKLLGIALVCDGSFSQHFVECHPAVALFASLLPAREYLFCTVIHKAKRSDMLLLLKRQGSIFKVVRHNELTLPRLPT